MNKLHVLMLAYYFPPDSSSGSFRSLFFANHLAEIGFKVTVLTARIDDFLSAQPVDYDLVKQINPLVNIIRTRVRRPRETLLNFRDKLNVCFGKRENKIEVVREGIAENKEVKISFVQDFKDTITDLLATPDPQIGWIFGVIKSGKKIIEKNNVNVIYATGSPWSAFLAGMVLKKITGKSLLLDFRDPWTANPTFITRGKTAAFIDAVLEKKVVKEADVIIANTEELRRDFINRYNFLTQIQVHTITNGFESYIESDKHNNRFTFVHTGSLYFSRDPGPFIKAIHNLIKNNKISPEKIRVMFIGGIEIYNMEVERLLRLPLLDGVFYITPRVSYEKAVSYQIGADVLFLIQPDFPLQVPRKLYEYLSARRPVLAITNPAGATARTINRNNLGMVVANDQAAIQDCIKKLYDRWENGKLGLLPKGLADGFLHSRLAQKLACIIEKLEKNMKPKPIKVAHITLSMNTGGIEKFIVNVIKSLNDAYDFTVGCLDSGGPLLKEVEGLGHKSFVLNRRPGFDWKLLFNLIRIFRREKFDLIHTHNEAAHFYGGLAAKLAGVPCLITTEHSRHDLDERLRRRVEKRFLALLTNNWITVSSVLADAAITKDGLSSEKVSVITNGIDINQFSRFNDDKYCKILKKNIGIPEDVSVVTMVARLHPIKNHAMLLKGIGSNEKLQEKVHVLFIGDGEMRKNLLKLSAQLHLTVRVHFLGIRKDVPELLSISDVFVLCSLSEGLPLSLLEAMAAKVPVVITKSANRAFLVIHDKNGTVVENSPEALAQGIIDTLSNKQHSLLLVQNGFELVNRKFSLAIMAAAYKEIYTNFLQKRTDTKCYDS